jgi:hypothetical protein
MPDMNDISVFLGASKWKPGRNGTQAIGAGEQDPPPGSIIGNPDNPNQEDTRLLQAVLC